MDENVLRDLDDAELLVGYKNTGDNKYFQELFQRYQRKIHGACLKFFRGNRALAEDASQNTFAKALEKAKETTVSSVAGWLFTMAKNCCIDIYRKQSTQVSSSEDPNNEQGGVTPETQDKNIEILELIQQINQLSDKQRISIKLYLEGHSYQEIAKVTLYSEKEVKSAIQTGKENLRKFFRGKERE
ncbi:MAG TPA: RNA polymerase sigma factor [Acidobacteriota bacterium]|nr:RNA polymerase sigma factor [Acidobacteriota bacterium]